MKVRVYSDELYPVLSIDPMSEMPNFIRDMYTFIDVPDFLVFDYYRVIKEWEDMQRLLEPYYQMQKEAEAMP